MAKNPAYRRSHPLGVITPEPVQFILYYVTRVLNKPVYLDTRLEIFRTAVLWEWIKENNLPPECMFWMGSSLKEYGVQIADEKSNIVLDQAVAERLEVWIWGWKQNEPHRTYRDLEKTSAYRQFLRN